MALDYFLSILQIILIDMVLSGDNAVVIALAAHKLPAHQRNRAILWGGGIAIFMRIVFTLVMAFLLMIPGLRLVGGFVLTLIACKLLLEEEEHGISADDTDRSALQAIKMIFVADFVMSLDNMLAVAGASHGDATRLLLGLLVSIGIIMTCSSLIARLMNRFKWIVYLGAGILAFTAGEMMIGDREVASYFVGTHHVILNNHWKEWLLTERKVSEFDVDELPEDMRSLVSYEHGQLTFVGQMSESHKQALLDEVETEADRQQIEEMYQIAHEAEVPGWMPEGIREHSTLWFQHKWPAEYWMKAKDNQYPWVSWLVYAIVVGVCMSAPCWHPGRKKKGSTKKDEGAEA